MAHRQPLVTIGCSAALTAGTNPGPENRRVKRSGAPLPSIHRDRKKAALTSAAAAVPSQPFSFSTRPMEPAFVTSV